MDQDPDPIPISIPTPSAAPSRVVVENVQPEIDAGRYPIKRTVGQSVEVTADIYADGHDVLAAVLRHRAESAAEWTEVPMLPLGNDRWGAAFDIRVLETHRYTVEAWVDAFRTWRRGLEKKWEAAQVASVDLLVGGELVAEAAERAAAAEPAAAAAMDTPDSGRTGTSDRATPTAKRDRGASAAARGRGAAMTGDRAASTAARGRSMAIGTPHRAAGIVRSGGGAARGNRDRAASRDRAAAKPIRDRPTARAAPDRAPTAPDRAAAADARSLAAHADALRDESTDVDTRAARALDAGLLALMDRYPDRSRPGRAPRELRVTVERDRARYGAWYEMFPRSAASEPGRHGTLRDAEARLGYVADMGFDVLYLPPVHPIGRTHRKGKNNDPAARPGDVGSPWAIGGPEGGHTSIHPDLGTLDDFRHLLAAAREKGIEVAMDVAFQCSPDHPWVREHPQWFRRRPDGSVQYAENPPKKYEDIYPIEFDTPDRDALWRELAGVVLFWIDQGVRIFRVDNPHTKAFPFWEWLIAEVRREHPDVVFLAEAFTRPKVMYGLAKIGFSQSYTYFTWRNTKEELTEYLRELTATKVREFFRPNLWPNTPDILPEPLQVGGKALFQARLVLAATLGASYGVYGPPFELMEARPRSPGSEEYLDSEKYEVRHWDLARADSLKDLIARVNRIRRENPALHDNLGLRFHDVENPQLIAYSKATADLSNVILVVVNLDPHHVHSGWLELPLEDLGLEGGGPFQVHDLLTDARFFWSGPRNFVQVDPQSIPAHVFRIRRRLRTERDFDYFL